MRGVILGSLAIAVVASSLASSGCRKKTAEPAAAQVQPPAKVEEKANSKGGPTIQTELPKPPVVVPEQPKKQASPVLARRIEIVEARNEFRQIGLAYTQYEITAGKGPSKLEDFGNSIARDTVQNIKDGYITVIWNAVKGLEPSNEIYAYESEPDATKQRVVLMANGEIRDVAEDEFKKMPKARARK